MSGQVFGSTVWTQEEAQRGRRPQRSEAKAVARCAFDGCGQSPRVRRQVVRALRWRWMSQPMNMVATSVQGKRIMLTTITVYMLVRVSAGRGWNCNGKCDGRDEQRPGWSGFRPRPGRQPSPALGRVLLSQELFDASGERALQVPFRGAGQAFDDYALPVDEEAGWCGIHAVNRTDGATGIPSHRERKAVLLDEFPRRSVLVPGGIDAQQLETLVAIPRRTTLPEREPPVDSAVRWSARNSPGRVDREDWRARGSGH